MQPEPPPLPASSREDRPTLGDRIRAEINARSSIGFDRFMEIALYGPGGFFERPPVGVDAHFVTSPHVSDFVFARCVRGAILDGWLALGEPDPLRIVEIGAGDGTLANALLEAFAELPAPSVELTAVEVARGARAALLARSLAVVADLGELAPFEGIVFANELLDNLPFLLARRVGDEVLEVRVTTGSGGALTTRAEPWSDDRLSPEALGLGPGEEANAPVGIATLLERLATRLRRGYVILVDYGRRGPAGTARGYARHRPVDDVLAAEPGSSDITAGVDVGLVARLAVNAGLQAWEPVRQRSALLALGYGRWDETMRARQVDQHASGEHVRSLRTWEARSRANVLVDPAHLGRLWWMVLATPGLVEPDWLIRARSA